jgi:hypothetical protein
VSLERENKRKRAARKLANPALWHVSGKPLPFGCLDCTERRLCGGLRVKAQMFDCMDLCCAEPDSCNQFACPKVARFSRLVNEVGSLELGQYMRPVRSPRTVPDYVPCMLDSSGIVGPLSIPVVAVSLYSVVDLRSGLARFSSLPDLLQHFRLDSRTRVILTATDKDGPVESFWEYMQPKATAASLRQLNPLLVATPNFSMHIDAPRHDNLLSMARIRFCFEAFAGAGLSVALHVNGRTPHDFSRWSEYIAASPGINTLTYEFGTMGRSERRRAWHAEQLVRLASLVGRPLRLLLRGGSAYLHELRGVYKQVTLLDTNALMRAKKRRGAVRRGDRVVWRNSPTDPGEPLDALFMHNVRVCRSAQRRARTLIHSGDSALTL